MSRPNIIDPREKWNVKLIDNLVKSRKAPVVVIPAFAGMTGLETFYETIKIGIIKAEALLRYNASALLLGCFRLGFSSTFSIGTEELHDAFNRNPDRYYQNTDIYHCQ